MTRRPPAALAAFAPPAGAVAAMAAFAAWQASAPAAAETAYLALLAGALLVCLGGLAPPTRGGRRLVAAASTLTVLAVWTLPAGSVRGAAAVALVVAALALAFAGRVAWTDRRGSAVPAHLRWRGTEAFAALLPAAVALQLLARSDRLLAVELTPRLAAGLFGLPLVAAAAVACLAARRGRDAALLAAGAAVVVSGGGIGAGAAGGLAVLALADVGWGLRGARRVATDPAAPGLASGSGPGGWGREAVVWAALVAVLAALAVFRDPGTAAVAAGAAALLAPAAAVRGTAGAAALAAALFAPAAGWAVAGDRLALAVAVLPAVAWTALPPRLPRRVLTEALPALALLVAAARCGGTPAATAVPLALLALLAARPATGAATPDPALAPQRAWSAVLVPLTALLAAFPWLRTVPAGDALALFGLGGGAGDAAVAVAAAVVLGLAARTTWLAPPSGWLHRPAAWTAAVLVVAAAAALPPGPVVPLLADGEVALDASRPELVVAFGPAADGGRSAVGSLVVVSNLSHAADVPDRRPVATVRLLAGDGAAAEWTLLAGRDTAEWAARRPDVAAAAAHPAPEPWLASVAPEGGFFGQLYRARWRAGRRLVPSRLEVRLAPGLPPGTVLHLYRVQAAP